jgi:predicted TIM-barrel fold metal-dependent hydrolase
MASRYEVISADSHLEINPDRWIERVPVPHRDRAPRAIKLENGGDAMQVEGGPLVVAGLTLCGGKKYEDFEPTGSTWEGSAGTGDGAQRIAEMERDGIDAEVLFPGFDSMVWGRIQNPNTRTAVFHAYNEFLIEEYVRPDPSRLLAMGVIPNTGLDAAIEELRYCAEGGLKGVALSFWPTGKSYPSEADDAFWQEALRLEIALTVHVQINLGNPTLKSGPALEYRKKPPVDMTKTGSDPVKRFAQWAMGGGRDAAQLVFSGTFDRIPELEVYFAENNLGWIPNFMYQLDNVYERNKFWAQRLYDLDLLDRPPSEIMRDHCHWGFIDDPIGVRLRHDVGIDNVMWCTDFPHSDSDWPHSDKLRDRIFTGVPDAEVRKMVCDNAVRFFHL